MLMPLAMAAMLLKIPICKSEPDSINGSLENVPPCPWQLSSLLQERQNHGIISSTGEDSLRWQRQTIT
jgi:hypothetical protein